MTAPAVKASHDIEYAKWLYEIDFYKAELAKMQTQLADFIPTFYTQSFAAMVERFQNRFNRQREVIDILRHDVKQHEKHIQSLQLTPSPELRDKVSRIHIRLRNDMATFIDLFVELERDFSDFLA
jgi:hypothetical protein